MALRKNFWKLGNAIFPFADFVYILQLEEYNWHRYLKWLPRFFLRRGIERREHLKYTSRAKLLIGCSVIIYILLLPDAFAYRPAAVQFLVAVVVTALIPLIVLMANLLLSPLFLFAHARARAEARRSIMAGRNSMKIVTVAGSYGKTTTKGFIEQLCKHHYRVQVPPGNTNTPLGIARWIVENLDAATTLLVLEVDGYTRKEYMQACSVAPADIAIITNVGDQHLERFGSRRALGKALAEVFLQSRPAAHLIATPHALAEFKEFDFESRTVHAVDPTEPLSYHGNPIEAPNLSVSQCEDLAFALMAAAILEIPDRFLQDGIKNVSVPERRQMRQELFGYEAIDDSYNISFSTASAAIAAARRGARAAGKKLLVIVAGIPELARGEQDKNEELGRLLAQKADHTIVLGSMFASELLRGVGHAPHTQVPELKEFGHLKERFLVSEWFLLLLPELGDLYY